MKVQESNKREKISIRKSVWIIARALKLSCQARKKASIIISILGLGMALVPMLISRILKEFTNGVYSVYTGDVDKLRYTLILWGILVILYIAQASYISVANYYNKADSISIHTFLREHIMRCACKVQYKYINNYDDFREKVEAIKARSGELVAQSMQQIIGCIQKFIAFISLLLLLLEVDIWIVLALIVATIPAILLAYYQKDEEYIQHSMQIKDRAFMMHYFNENVQPEPMNEVRFLGLSEYIKKKWKTAGDKFVLEKNAMTKKHVIYNSIADFFRNGVFIVVLIIIWKQIFTNPSVGLGLFLMVMTSASQFQKVATELFVVTAQIIGNIRYMEDFFSLEDLDKEAEKKNLAMIEKPDIVFSNVNFSYPNSTYQVLKDINISIPFGQKVAIVGENGSGKSTFVNLLCGMYDSFSGDICLNGKSIKENVADVREILSVAFQDFGRYEDTIRYNVKVSDLNKNTSDEEIIKLLKEAGAYDVLLKQNKGLDEVLGTFSEKTNNLSGGEWQKIALARAMYRDKAQIAILDEPTAALDPLAESELYRNFANVTSNKTALLISHRLGFSSFIDRILVFHKGSIVEDGTHEELMKKNGYYAEMFKAQAQWYN